ncbi:MULTISPECIES: kappa-carrageenase [Reichenbachiella]|uniref:kappa-carrageenase n=1 Tax=Reichenbachiella TaxID=156993 RepID=UPI0011C44EDF|nr:MULTISPECIES: kappa-carrageenase [Reichenbachiella]MBU2912760.1 family 16 glycosylhydrolase [Reichenbachiella agariperforans]
MIEWTDIDNREMKGMRRLVFSLIVVIVGGLSVHAQSPASHTGMLWNVKPEHSDEFDSFDANKWNSDLNDWGTWSWEPDLAYVKEGMLNIKMIQETHQRGGKEFYYKSGIVRQEQTITYGYFETRIKGCDRFPGASPAFWLYSVGQPTPTEEGGVQYSEIDVVELTQREWDFETNDWEGPEVIDMNLHTRIIKDGQLTWIRPGGYPDITRNKWHADFDPRDDYHTYGVLSRKDSIFWYVDGIERGRKENLYWHLPMYVTVSMGLRSPFEKYVSGDRITAPEETTNEGFPTEMHCDYVRVWEAPPQIVTDASVYQNTTYGLNQNLEFDAYYDAGSGFTVQSEGWKGITVILAQKDANGQTIQEAKTNDVSIVGQAAGRVKVQVPLEGLTISDDLPDGHYYELNAFLKSSKNGGEEVSLQQPIMGITLVDQVLSADEPQPASLQLYPNPAHTMITLAGLDGQEDVQVYNIQGMGYRLPVIAVQTGSLQLDVSSLPAGIYLVSVANKENKEILKFTKKQ